MSTSYLDLALDGDGVPPEPVAQQDELERMNEVTAHAVTDGTSRDAAGRPQADSGRGHDVAWIKERMKGIYELIKEALREGYLGPAQQVGADVVAAVEQVAKEGGDIARACRLLSRDGAGNDVAAAALLAGYEQLCHRLAAAGVDPFRRRAAVALCLARALEPAGGLVVTDEGTLRRPGRARAGRAALHRTAGTAGNPD